MKCATNSNLVQNLTDRVILLLKSCLFATCYLIYLCSRAYLLKHPMLRILMDWDFGFHHQHKLVISVAFWGCYHQRSSVAACCLSPCRSRPPATTVRFQRGRMPASGQCTRECRPSSFRHRPPAASTRLQSGRGRMPSSAQW